METHELSSNHSIATILRMPFDLAREHYAMAVRLGLTPNSPLHSARAARMIAAAERATIGPWARSR